VTAPSRVTVLVPTRNEARDIEGCLLSIAAQDHPLDLLEVIVVDGGSDDGTVDVARRVLGRFGFESGNVLTNPAGTTPRNLNMGLAEATAPIVCRVDARTRIEPHHVRTCAAVLEARPDVSVVGGAQVALARDDSPTATGIARALNNRWSMGGSPYRAARTSRASDTVYLGAFRAADLRTVGGWDERLATNQDFDLNQRLGERGTVWFEASLRSGYLPRSSLRTLGQQYVRFGRWKARYWAVTGRRPGGRQAAMVVGGPVALGGLVLAARADARAALFPVAGLLVVDALGSDERGAPVATRAVSVAAIAVVTGGWLVGVWAQLLRIGRSAGRAAG
jgi:succinoglycan biosynthesis protein ExoA